MNTLQRCFRQVKRLLVRNSTRDRFVFFPRAYTHPLPRPQTLCSLTDRCIKHLLISSRVQVPQIQVPPIVSPSTPYPSLSVSRPRPTPRRGEGRIWAT